MRNLLLGVLGAVGIAASASAQFTLLANIDLIAATEATNTTNRIGTNIGAVAWDGSKLYIAGRNNSGSTLQVGILEVSTPLTSPTLGPLFGTANAAAGRGYSGLATNGSILASTEETGAAAGIVRTWNQTTNAQIGARTNLGTNAGTAFNPGFNQQAGSSTGNLGVAAVGSGRHLVVNPNAPALDSIYATTAAPVQGAIWNSISTGSGGMGTQYRDLAFNAATGDIYGRSANAITKAIRTGDNSFGPQTVIWNNYGPGGQASAAGVNQQNLAFMNTPFGDFIIFNDRPSGTLTPGDISTWIKMIDTNGNLQSIQLPLTIQSTAGIYDFAYHAGTNTLAISDASNSRVYILGNIPAPGAAALLGLGGLVAARRRRA
jgi:hypothetical protein